MRDILLQRILDVLSTPSVITTPVVEQLVYEAGSGTPTPGHFRVDKATGTGAGKALFETFSVVKTALGGGLSSNKVFMNAQVNTASSVTVWFPVGTMTTPFLPVTEVNRVSTSSTDKTFSNNSTPDTIVITRDANIVGLDGIYGTFEGVGV